MYKRQNIKRLAAGLLLFVFILSITPKQWLHDLVTNHKDSWAVSFAGKQTITSTGFHCNCDNLVAESPFIYYDGPAEPGIAASFVLHQTATSGRIISSYHYFSSLRGPPAGM
jgi:hypothetical protein